MLTPLPDYPPHDYTVQCFSQRTGGLICDLLVDTEAQIYVVSKEFWQKPTKGGSELAPYLGKVSVADGG